MIYRVKASQWKDAFLLLVFCCSVLSLQLEVTNVEPLRTNGSNPDFQTIMFDESKKFRQDVCERYRQYYNDEIKLEDALDGLNISSVFECPNPYCFMEGNELHPHDAGIFAVLMDEIASRAGFNWRDNYALTDPSKMDNKTFDDLLAWSTETYDIATSWWTKTTDRIREGIEFPEGWYEADIILVGKVFVEDTTGFDFFRFGAPFDLLLWAAIIGTIILSGLVYYLLEVIDVRSDLRDLHKSPIENIFLAFVTFTAHFEFRPRTKAAWVFALSLTFWAMIVGAAYTANLASFFVVKNTSAIQIQSVQDAVNARYRICVIGTTAADKILSEDFRNGNFIPKKDEKGALQGVIDGDCQVAAIDKGNWDTQRQNPDVGCELEWIGRKYREIPAGFATRHDSGTKCSSIISEVLSIHFRDMILEGFVKRAWIDHLQKIGGQQTCDAEAAEEDLADSQQLKLKSMAGIFLFHGIICVCVVAFELISKATGMTKKRNKRFSMLETEKLKKEMLKKNIVKTSILSESMKPNIAIQSSSMTENYKIADNIVDYNEDNQGDNHSLAAIRNTISELRSENLIIAEDMKAMREQMASILDLLKMQSSSGEVIYSA